MRFLETLNFFFLLVSLTEAQQAQGNCDITSITSPSASNLLIKWMSFPGATNYALDLRVVNNPTVSPVTLDLTATTTEKLVQGLRPGSQYQVTFKVYQFYYVLCISYKIALTVPAASQLTFARAASSTSASFQWTNVSGADSYVLMVEGTFHSEHRNLSFSTLSGDMTGLQPASTYSCYIYSSNAAGLGTKSNVKTINTLVPPPASVTVTMVSNSAVRVTWPSVSGVVLYQVSLVENNRTGVAPLAWNTSALALNIPNLKPCTNYTVRVSSMNTFLQPGEPVTASYASSSITSVTSISADYSCSNAMATVSWDSVPGATSYRAVATARDGTTLSCQTVGTSCQISALGCGEQYTVRIVSIAECESVSNISYTFETAPCPPKNPEIYHECLSNVVIFSWNATNNTAYYIAMSVDADGVTNECLTLYNSCYFTQTECGRSYNFTVSSVYAGTDGCSSGSTAPVTISTAPCLPQSVTTSAMDCLSDTLIARWEPAPGALRYFVEAHGNHDDFYNCTSNGTSCAMTNVKCGQSLSVWITAYNNRCATDTMLAEVAETVPCVPQQVSVSDTCGSFSVTLSWMTSNNAILYTAKAILPDSSIRSCYTKDTECEIKDLQCGQTYEVFVMSTNFICNSSDSQHFYTQTAPCAPVSVQAQMDCQLNTATVHWLGQQAGGSYTALLADGDGGVLNCSTSSNNCSVPNLRCGQTYNVTVLQNLTQCNSLPSTSIMMTSVPCAPQQVVGKVNCSTGVMSVGWNSSVGGVNYTAAVWSGSGAQVYCNTSDTHCNVGQLDCGKVYSVAVLASRGTCQSPPSQLITVEQVPCVPIGVSVSRVCGTGSVGISWSSTAGAHSYTAIAVRSDGQSSQCTSAGTNCSIANLTCGQVYSVGVVASNNNCSSQISQTVSLHTEPCTPASVSGLMNCSSSTASLLWALSPNAVHYIGTLQSSGHLKTCNVSTAGCQISGLLCGQQYNFTVSASDGSCSSTPSAPIQLDTAPCPTQNVSTTLACNSNSLTVSWSLAAVFLNYVATAVWSGGTALSCSSQNTSCSMQGLQCGQQYNVTVTASNGNCSGPASPVTTVHTAPCVPQNVTGLVTCGSGSLVASWIGALGASSYAATVSASGGVPQVCVTSGLSCVFSGLQCATQYSLSVASQNEICNSSSSPATTIRTGPCDPQNVTASLQCSSGAATVTWSASDGASGYTVLAQTDGVQTLAATCSTSSSSCQLTSLTCGKTFNITVLAGDATCNTTSKPSTTVVTAPCKPVNVSVDQQCSSNSAVVRWGSSVTALTYSVTALDSLGGNVTCSSVSTSCVLTGLSCGRKYNVTVVSRNSQCVSEVSSSVELSTAPCNTTVLSFTGNCSSNSGKISWASAAGATVYNTRVMSGNVQVTSCSTADTSCVVSLDCGQSYSAVVVASSGICNSSDSPSLQFRSAPCLPQNVSAALDCAANLLAVRWQGTSTTDLYTAVATSSSGQQASCNISSTTSCSISGLQCGQTYNISVVSSSSNCSTVSGGQIQSAPCKPVNVSVDQQCSSNSAVVRWGSSVTALTYSVTALDSLGGNVTCSSVSTSCVLTGLSCGRKYNVTVVSRNSQCVSEVSSSVELSTAPCNTTVLSFTGNCSSNSGKISWASAAGATVYNTRVMAGNVQVTSCSTADTSCVVSLDCGQSYSAVVVASSGICNSSDSPSLQFRSAPCLPQNVSAALDCAANLLAVRWQGTSTTDLYTAVATSSSGQQASCNISSTTSCSISGLQCGQTYNISVVSSSSNCSTVSGGQIQSAPCKPVNVSVDQQCSSNSAVVRWGSSVTALTYSVTALDSLGGNVTCSSVSTSCVLTGLSCGRKYNVTVVSRNSQCVSEVSSSVELSTAPCNTTVLSFTGNCSSNSGKISWASAAGATVYNTRVMAGNVQVTSCSTADTSCVVSLDCGQSYSAVVVASSGICNSSDSPSLQFRSAPCLPQNVSAALDCAANLLAVRWQGTSTTDLYTAVATSSSGQQASCNISSTTSCSISGLQCGQTYNISVVSSSSNCSTVSGGQIQSAPCKPVNVSVDQQCSSNSAVVRWGSSESALTYSVTALDSLGGNVTCSSVSTSCVLTGLSCGRKYNVTVVSRNSQCVSEVSSSVELSTAPCSPTHVTAILNCTSNSVSVSWDTLPGVTSYLVNAVGSAGYNSSCSSSGPQCSITGLHCGQDYSITVSAQNNGCSGPASQNITLSAAPCPSTNLQASLDCSSSSALISWMPGNGTQYSNVTIQTLQPPQLLFCISNGSSCNISALPCGQSYTVTATGYRQSCSTPSDVSVLLNTAPCVPQNVQSQLLTCQSGDLSVSWQPSAGALSYRAEAVTLPGHLLSCDSNSTSCVISALSCGQSYDVNVVGAGDGCNSSYSITRIARGAPCPPSSVTAVVNCTNNTAVVSWTSLGFVGSVYIATAISITGSPTGAQCNSTGSSCALTGLQCGTQYNVTVTATKDNCTSLPSAVYSFPTAPCVPSLDGVSLDCGSGSAVAVWSGAGSADLYSVSAVDGQGDQLSCNSTQTQSCSVSGLRCGRTYTFSVTALRGQCTSTASNTLQAQTAPCPAQAVQTTIGCHNSTATVSWSPGSGAVSYTATLQSSDGNTYTCNSTGTSCDITHLPCGQSYSVTVSAKGQNCSGTNSTGSPVKTAPCAPQILSASVNCSRNIATVSWRSSLGALVYFITANSSSGLSANCTSVNTSCDLSTLACGLNYTVTVMAKDNNCSSACSAPVQLQTVPCVPQNIVPLVDCAANGVSVSWSPSLGAHRYTVTLQDSNGLSGTCQSSGGQCNVTGLSCGRVYHVSVTASDNQCISASSTSTDFQSVPCAPSSISAVLNCTTDTAVVAWGAGAGSQGYSVSAVASLGRITGCSSNNSSTSCTLSNLKCGVAYTVSVQTLGASCNSSTTMSSQLITEPCVPQNLSMQYDTVVGLLFWDFTPGADRFTALAKASQGPNDKCLNVTDTFCTLSNTECGQIYNITVTAYNSACNGTATATSLPYSLLTEPCPPQNVRTELNCSTHITSVSWDASLVAVGYVVFLDGRNGDFLVFSTQRTSFSIPGLSCGTVYTTYVQALGQVYNSSYSESVNLLSAPCSPDSAGVLVQMDCATDTALISWPFSAGADNYTAIVRGSGGYLTSCSTQNNHCNVTVQCGQTYNLTLTSTNQQCQMPSNTNTTFRSSPCAPTGLVVAPGSGCGSAAAILSWNAADAEQYLLRGWSRDGHALFISTNKTTVNLNHLHCSQDYNFTITASNQQCNSTPSVPAQLQTGPCSAGNITAALDCSSSTAVVSWQPSNNSALYTATLQDSSGPPLSCVGVGSQCSISGLSCGKNYSVTLTVTNDQCNSTTVLPSGLQTGPCAPVNVSVLSYCANNSAVVLWDQSTGATSYHVYANSSNSHVSCQSTTPTCILTNLTCGSTYSVQVVAEGSCTSVPSLPVALNTGPCQPQNLSVDVQCVNSTAVLSWAAQTGAVEYFATAQSTNSTLLYCQTTGTSCTLEGLQCGSAYNFSVVASNRVCNSSASKQITGGGVPCPPATFRVVLSVLMGLGQLLRAYWSTVNCPDSRYLLEVSGSIQGNAQSFFQMTSYWTDRAYFETPIPCGSTYSTSVRAQNSAGTSAPSAVLTGISVPCPPLSVTFTGSNASAVVSWNPSLYANVYHVYQVTGNSRVQLCNTTGLSCTVNNVNSNLIVVTAGNTAGESAGTSDLQVLSGGVRRRRDAKQTKLYELNSPKAKFTMATADSLWLEWKSVKGAMFYSMLIREQSSSSKPVTMIAYGEASIISDLKPATTYCVSLSAGNESTEGPFSEPVCVRTAALS